MGLGDYHIPPQDKLKAESVFPTADENIISLTTHYTQKMTAVNKILCALFIFLISREIILNGEHSASCLYLNQDRLLFGPTIMLHGIRAALPGDIAKTQISIDRDAAAFYSACSG